MMWSLMLRRVFLVHFEVKASVIRLERCSDPEQQTGGRSRVKTADFFTFSTKSGWEFGFLFKCLHKASVSTPVYQKTQGEIDSRITITSSSAFYC